MRRLAILGFIVAACGDSGTNPPPVGSECAGLDQCGAGVSNYVEVMFCEHCFARADSHVCESGLCRALPSMAGELGVIDARFSISGFATAQSFAQASVLPTKADGTRLTCASLASGSDWENNKTINAVLSNFRVIPAGGDTVVSLISVDPGPDRLYFVALTTEVQGKGRILAQGCAEGIAVVAGQTVMVPVQLEGVP